MIRGKGRAKRVRPLHDKACKERHLIKTIRLPHSAFLFSLEPLKLAKKLKKKRT